MLKFRAIIIRQQSDGESFKFRWEGVCFSAFCSSADVKDISLYQSISCIHLLGRDL